MKCEMCGTEVEDWGFVVYMPVTGKEDKVLKSCGRCNILAGMNDNLVKLWELLSSNQERASHSPIFKPN